MGDQGDEVKWSENNIKSGRVVALHSSNREPECPGELSRELLDSRQCWAVLGRYEVSKWTSLGARAGGS